MPVLFDLNDVKIKTQCLAVKCLKRDESKPSAVARLGFPRTEIT